MSRPRSQVSKILRQANRMEKKQVARERAGKIAGETEEQELARKKRDLSGFLDMYTERQLNEKLSDAMKTSEETEK